MRPSQYVSFNFSDGFIPFSVHGRKRSVMKLPAITKCRGVGIKISGTLLELKNLTVGSECQFALENTVARNFDFEHVLVQRLGQLTVKNRDNVEMKIDGVTFGVHGGGKVINACFLMYHHHQFLIENAPRVLSQYCFI